MSEHPLSSFSKSLCSLNNRSFSKSLLCFSFHILNKTNRWLPVSKSFFFSSEFFDMQYVRHRNIRIVCIVNLIYIKNLMFNYFGTKIKTKILKKLKYFTTQIAMFKNTRYYYTANENTRSNCIRFFFILETLNVYKVHPFIQLI